MIARASDWLRCTVIHPLCLVISASARMPRWLSEIEIGGGLLHAGYRAPC